MGRRPLDRSGKGRFSRRPPKAVKESPRVDETETRRVRTRARRIPPRRDARRTPAASEVLRRASPGVAGRPLGPARMSAQCRLVFLQAENRHLLKPAKCLMWGRLSTCPTNSAGSPVLGKLSGIAHECVRHAGGRSTASPRNPSTARRRCTSRRRVCRSPLLEGYSRRAASWPRDEFRRRLADGRRLPAGPPPPAAACSR